VVKAFRINQCAELIEAATPAVFINNAFRITGLAVDASPREIAERFATLKRRPGLNATAAAKPHAHHWELPATLDQLRDAEHRLQSPHHRLIDEIFWFWPVAECGSTSDVALHAVAAGDFAAAEKIWKTPGSHPAHGTCAAHNLAIRWHLTALRLENRWHAHQSDDKSGATLAKCWRYALERWDLVLSDDLLWARIEQRIRALDDPRISPSLTGQLRCALPWALVSINAALAIAHAEADEPALAAMHVRLIRDNQLIVPARQYANMVFARAAMHLRQHLRTATTRRTTNPLGDLGVARELVQKLVQYDRIFAELGSAQSPAGLELIDQGLEVCMVSADAFHPRNYDNVGFMSVMERALPLAKSATTRARAQSALDAARQGVLDEMLAPLYKAFATVNDSTECPAHRYAAFGREVLPLLTTTVTDVPLSVAAWTAASDAAARVLRTISKDAWPKARDAPTASAALKDARTHALSDALRNLLDKDSTSLDALVTEYNSVRRNRLIGGAAWCAGAVVLSVLASLVNSHRPIPWQLDVTTGASVVPPARWASSGVNAALASGQDDRVRNDVAGELAGGMSAVDEQAHTAQLLEAQYYDAWSVFHEQELEANVLEQQAREQLTQIDAARLRVNNSDPAALEDLHGKEDYYSSLVRRASAARVAANALVDPLNALSQRVSAQNAFKDRLLSDHNGN
jgi:hypothetical protein